MANPEHLQILQQGVEAWNAWRRQNEDIRPDLSRANFGGADLLRANFGGADLREADLREADLREANLDEVHLFETVFSNTDLTAVQGLETCRHGGPSTLDHRTLARSEQLPLAFLRGCGLNDWEIEVTKLYDPRLTSGQVTDILYRIHHLRTDPLIQFYSCFISYNHTDAGFAHSLHDRLQDEGFAAGVMSTRCCPVTTSTRKLIVASDCGTKCCSVVLLRR